MLILKCKMCGGNVQPDTDKSFGVCENCETRVTLPKVSDEQMANRFNRANHYRQQGEFDKAIRAYEAILNDDSASAEAYWGLVLSRYGIEYEKEEPDTQKRIPTCHRVQSDSILSDADYKLVLQYAPDEDSKAIYEKEAREIHEIQKSILAISNKEKPYDVFICYKDKADDGKRTMDSAIAQDIYERLTKENLRVFFSRITLEDKLGQNFESFIFSALNSAKVMLVIGTKREYFEAKWVKNEWSRFLKIMKKDCSRLLIPCYRDMDAYDIPEEFSDMHLHGKDMSEPGCIHDIVHIVKKALDRSKSADSVIEGGAMPITTAAAPGVESLMKRGRLFLEDGDWIQADEYFDKVLDIDPEYAQAYVGKLCAELRLYQEHQLANSAIRFDGNGYFQKALRFASADYKATLEGYDYSTRDRLWQNYYNGLVQEKDRGATEERYKELAGQFRNMNGYGESEVFASECDERYMALKTTREEKERAERERVIMEKRKSTILRTTLGGIVGGLLFTFCYLLVNDFLGDGWMILFLVVMCVFGLVGLCYGSYYDERISGGNSADKANGKGNNNGYGCGCGGGIIGLIIPIVLIYVAENGIHPVTFIGCGTILGALAGLLISRKGKGKSNDGKVLGGTTQ